MLQQIRMKVVQFHGDCSPVFVGVVGREKAGSLSCEEGVMVRTVKLRLHGKAIGTGASGTLVVNPLANTGKRIFDLHPSNGLS